MNTTNGGMDGEAKSLWMVTTTIASEDEAFKLADGMVTKSLAACVQVEGPIRSIYRFKGEIHRDVEYRLVIKTTDAGYPDLLVYLRSNHPYEVPQITGIKIDDTDPGYLAWAAKQTTR